MSKNRNIRILLYAFFIISGLYGTVYADTYRTPHAGEDYTTTLFGTPVEVSSRDRNSVSAINLGLYWIPDGPEEQELLPFGALFLWRNWKDGKERFRGVFSGIYNEVRYNTTPSLLKGAEAVFTFDNITIPFDRSEYVEGIRIAKEELEWYQVKFGMGLGYRIPLAPWHQDNALEVALTYEPGILLFRRGDEADPAFVVPKDTYEGRIHFRLRVDALERNLLELPHRGFAGGLDSLYGHRDKWEDWGGPLFGIQRGGSYSYRDWFATSIYGIAVSGLPFIQNERHRLITSVYSGIGKDLDRFSAFRLSGGSNNGDWETLSRPILPGAAFDEFFTKKYGILNFEYRYEALAFLYLHLKGTLAWVDRPRFKDDDTVINRTEPMHSITASVTSGFLWDSQIEIGYTHNFGILRERDGRSEYGGEALLFSWTKEF